MDLPEKVLVEKANAKVVDVEGNNRASLLTTSNWMRALPLPKSVESENGMKVQEDDAKDGNRTPSTPTPRSIPDAYTGTFKEIRRTRRK
jgi:hypothetical protein